MNGGILLFRPTEAIKAIFSDINAHVKRVKDNGEPMPNCADQPFMNYHFIKNDRYNNTMLEKHGLIYCIDPPPPPSAPTDVVLCHFVWPIGNAGHKLGRMRPHVSHVLKHYLAIMGKDSVTSEHPEAFVGSSYNWGNDGGIRFEANGILHTTWRKGTYEWLDSFTLFASWAGFQHFVRFDSTYKTYMSVRVGDLDFTTGSKKMNFVNEHGNPVDTTRFETSEQIQAEKYITEDCVVLELGARYGTVSCVINKNLKDPRNQVSVEPDKTVWACLEKNMISNGCSFHLVKGVISRVPLELTKEPTGYGNSTVKSDHSTTTIPTFTLAQVEAQYNLKFNTLVADCEGFLGQFFEENPQLYEQLTLCIFEKDCPDRCDYGGIINNLKGNGFTNIVTGFHEVWKKV
jgi:FkbM family methyltransferase